ncbi:CotH kinase family protein [Candidatus Cloacimonadota bacterium]
MIKSNWINVLGILLFCLPNILIAQSIFINEAMSSNSMTIYDEDGDSPDWIEIYNAETYEVSLDGFGLSDDVADPFKWEFPDVSIPAQGHLIVFASGKNRNIAHWETIIDWGDDWRYFVGTEAPPAEWYQLGFDDTGWLTGPSGFGYGDGDDNTIISEIGSFTAMSVFIRHSFIISDVNDIASVLLNIDYDDAFVAWLNGVEVARENIIGDFPAYNDSLNISAHEAQMYQGLDPNSYFIENIQSILLNGDNVLTIQANTLDTDLSMIPFLTLGYYSEPATIPNVSPYIESLVQNLHTNFKIGDFETLYISDTVGNGIDQLSVDELLTDISIGHQPDGSSNLFFFFEPTPGSSNTTSSYGGISSEPVIETEAGFYEDPVIISISGSGTGETIYYSLNGAVPSDTSSVSYIYTGQFQIDSTTTLRARSFQPGFVPSKTITKTFLLNTDHYLPVISLTTDPYNFFDYNYGIYALGPNASPTYPNLGANFWQDWERPVHLEMFEEDNSLVLNTDCGIKIFGYYSRWFPQKSLALFARGQYGDNSFEHQIFEDKPYSSFQSIVLRNSGGDWLWTNIRDGFMADNLQDTNLSYQAFRPAVCYLNGEYWGIYNIREKLNEHFYASNFGVDPDNIDYLENNREVIIGEATYYNQMMDYIDTHDLSIQEYYDQVCTMMDMDNFISFYVAQMWYNNTDMPAANVKYWRERTPDAKWRWQIYDLDLGMGMIHGNDLNMLDYMLSEVHWGGEYRNEPWSTYLFRRLVENNSFVEQLVNCFADYMNTIFDEEYLGTKVDDTFDYLYQEMEHHMIRWEGDFSSWYNNERLVMKWFADGDPSRNDYMEQYIIEEFNFPGTANIYLDIEPYNSGTVQVNTLEISEAPWDGTYFQTNPVTLTGLFVPGWEFAGWTGDVNSNSAEISLDMVQDYSLIAWFEPATVVPNPIAINEINYNSSPDFDVDDWIEIYNATTEDIDMSNWQFKDSDDTHFYEFPYGLVLSAEEYFVICRDIQAFQDFFPDVTNVIGNFDFGLSGNGDTVRIFDESGNLIDEVHYEDTNPWPPEPDGNGPTLSLLNPGMDNTLAMSWAASAGHGTPGEINDVYVSVQEDVIAIQDEIRLLQNFPNPFNPTTSISFSLPDNCKINLSIYNMKGQLVKILVQDFLEKGVHSFIWNGRDSSNKPVSSGIYFYRISDRHTTQTRKMLLIK